MTSYVALMTPSMRRAALEAIRGARIEAHRTARGGWTAEQLAAWGVSWPPPKGWKKKLISEGFPGEELW